MPVSNSRRDVLIGLCCATLASLAARAAGNETPEAGTDFLVLQNPQPLQTGDKIEVTEFFQYSCPHCFAFTPDLNAWRKHWLPTSLTSASRLPSTPRASRTRRSTTRWKL